MNIWNVCEHRTLFPLGWKKIQTREKLFWNTQIFFPLKWKTISENFSFHFFLSRSYLYFFFTFFKKNWHACGMCAGVCVPWPLSHFRCCMIKQLSLDLVDLVLIIFLHNMTLLCLISSLRLAPNKWLYFPPIRALRIEEQQLYIVIGIYVYFYPLTTSLFRILATQVF